MAAGLVIQQTDFARFSRVFDQTVRETLTDEDLRAVITTDGSLEPAELDLATAQAISEGGLWGQSFFEPLFDDLFEVISKRIVGDKHWKLVLRHHSGAPVLDGIAFNKVDQFAELPERIHAVYRLDMNTWRNQISVQLRIEHLASLT